MKTLSWLLKREFWEHRGAFFWTPAVIGAAMVLLGGGSVLYNIVFHGRREPGVIKMTGGPSELLSDVISFAYMGLATPLFMMMAIVTFFYAIASMYDERRDRSILFWKSLPVSDGMTVLSKALAALVLMPLITLAAATLTSALMLPIMLLALQAHGVDIAGKVFTTPALYLAPLQVLSLLPVYIVWALPTLGWLMLVSSWARSKAFLWAVGLPLVSVAGLKILELSVGINIDVNAFFQNVVGRGLFGFLPGVWYAYAPSIAQDMLHASHDAPPNVGRIVLTSWQTLATPAAIGGAVAGLAMLAGAVRMRRYRDDS